MATPLQKVSGQIRQAVAGARDFFLLGVEVFLVDVYTSHDLTKFGSGFGEGGRLNHDGVAAFG